VEKVNAKKIDLTPISVGEHEHRLGRRVNVSRPKPFRRSPEPLDRRNPAKINPRLQGEALQHLCIHLLALHWHHRFLSGAVIVLHLFGFASGNEQRQNK